MSASRWIRQRAAASLVSLCDGLVAVVFRDFASAVRRPLAYCFWLSGGQLVSVLSTHYYGTVPGLGQRREEDENFMNSR